LVEPNDSALSGCSLEKALPDSLGVATADRHWLALSQSDDDICEVAVERRE
jgi:hypothetical protein